MATYTPQGFSNLGATPYQSPSTLGYTSPIASANTTQNTQPNWQTTLGNVLGVMNKNPIKSTKVQTPDGGSVTHQYMTPLPENNSSSSTAQNTQSNNSNSGMLSSNQTTSTSTIPAGNTYNPQTGLYSSGVNATGGAGNNTSGQNLTAGQQNQQTTNTSNPVTFPGLIGQSATTSQGNIPLGANAQTIANNAGQEISQIGQQGGNIGAGYLSTGTGNFGPGNAAIVAQTTAAKQQAVAAGANMQLAGNSQALTAQNQAQSGLLGTATAVAPQAGATFFGSNLTGGLVSPNGANASTGTTGNPLIDNSVQNAYNQMIAGASYGDATANLVGGSIAQQALLAKLGPNFNPTATNTIAAQNASQGASTQGKAFALDTGLKQLATLQPVVTSFIQNSGLNSSANPLANQGIDKYIQSLGNTAAGAQAQLMMNEISNYSSQIIASASATTPTDVTEKLAAVDPSLLNASQLQTYMDTLATLGQNQLGVLQSQEQASYGNSGGYAGTPAGSAATNIPVGTGNGVTQGLNPTNTAQALAGGATGLAGEISNGVQTMVSNPSNILSFIAGDILGTPTTAAATTGAATAGAAAI